MPEEPRLERDAVKFEHPRYNNLKIIASDLDRILRTDKYSAVTVDDAMMITALQYDLEIITHLGNTYYRRYNFRWVVLTGLSNITSVTLFLSEQTKLISIKQFEITKGIMKEIIK